MRQAFKARSTQDGVTATELGLEVAPGVAVTESAFDDGWVLLHVRSGCSIGRNFDHPEEAAHAFQVHLAHFDWIRPGPEIALDLEVLMAVREFSPGAGLLPDPSRAEDVA